MTFKKFKVLRRIQREAAIDLSKRRAWFDEKPNEEPPAEQQNDGEIDLTKLDPAVAKLIQKLIDDKRAGNEEAKKYKKQLRDIEASQTEAQRKEAEDQGNHKKLYETERQERERLAKELADERRLRIASDYKLPKSIAELLKGDTVEDMQKHAETLRAELGTPQQTPPPKAPGAQHNTTPVPGGQPAKETDAQRRDRLYGGGKNIFEGGGVVIHTKSESFTTS